MRMSPSRRHGIVAPLALVHVRASWLSSNTTFVVPFAFSRVNARYRKVLGPTWSTAEYPSKMLSLAGLTPPPSVVSSQPPGSSSLDPPANDESGAGSGLWTTRPAVWNPCQSTTGVPPLSWFPSPPWNRLPASGTGPLGSAAAEATSDTTATTAIAANNAPTPARDRDWHARRIKTSTLRTAATQPSYSLTAPAPPPHTAGAPDHQQQLVSAHHPTEVTSPESSSEPCVLENTPCDAHHPRAGAAAHVPFRSGASRRRWPQPPMDPGRASGSQE